MEGRDPGGSEGVSREGGSRREGEREYDISRTIA